MNMLATLADSIAAFDAAKDPAPGLAERIVWVDWREDEVSLTGKIAAQLKRDERLSADWLGTTLYLTLGEDVARIPLSMSRHDAYITLSSLAGLLGEHYELLLLRATLDQDRHGLLGLTKSATKVIRSRLGSAFSRYLLPARPGFDYFFSIDVPYLDHEDSAPEFERERAEIERSIEDERRALGIEAGPLPGSRPWWKFWA